MTKIKPNNLCFGFEDLEYLYSEFETKDFIDDETNASKSNKINIIKFEHKQNKKDSSINSKLF